MGRSNKDFNAGQVEGPAQNVSWVGESGDSYNFNVPANTTKKVAGKTIAAYTSIDRSYKQAGVQGQTVEEPVKGSIRWNK